MHPGQTNDYSEDFADKASSIMEKIRLLKKNYESCLLLDKEFHELKTITVEINRHQLKYNHYMEKLGKHKLSSAGCKNELAEQLVR